MSQNDDIGATQAQALFMQHRSQLLGYAAALLGERQQAEDLVQDAYLRFTAAMAEERLEEPTGYLYRIVRNLALDRHRSRRREAKVIIPVADHVRDIAEDKPSPESEALHRAELRVLKAALDELPERTRRALEMHRFGGAKLREIAASLGISTSTAHTLVMDGMAHCRRRLARWES